MRLQIQGILYMFIKKEVCNLFQPDSPQYKFCDAFTRNFLLALVTVPSERFCLEEIFFCLNNPGIKPPAYRKTFNEIGLKRLFSGAGARVSYCLSGNFATLVGLNHFGSDYEGLFKTAVAKNLVLPIFLISNARQINLNWHQT